VAVGDFNGSGLLDLAVANYGTSGGLGVPATVSVLLGNGDGSFQATQNYVAGQFPRAVAVGDFNGDGQADLAVVSEDSVHPTGLVSILLGLGDGTFQASRSYTVGSQPDAVVVGDFEGNGTQDFAVANYASATVSVLRGNGDGTFQARTDYPVDHPDSVAVGDFNGDGIADLAVTSYFGTVSVLLSNGDGTFQDPVSYPAGDNPVSVAVGDFNNDGTLDLAVADQNGGTVRVLLGNGDGTFHAPVSYFANAKPQSVVVGDFQGGGTLDLAVVNFGANTVSVLLGNGNGTFQAPVSYAVASGPRALAVGDFRSDGVLDLVTSNNSGPTGTVSVLLGNGNGSFQAHKDYSSGGSNPFNVAVGDFRNDGKLDIVAVNQNQSAVAVLLGNGNGSFQVARTFYAGAGDAVAVGDLNGDGFPDLAIVAHSGKGAVSILLNAADWGGGYPAAGSKPRPAIGHLRTHHQPPRDLVSGPFATSPSPAVLSITPATPDRQANAIPLMPGFAQMDRPTPPEATLTPTPYGMARHGSDAALEDGDDLERDGLMWNWLPRHEEQVGV
jgi:hypothetical protein